MFDDSAAGANPVSDAWPCRRRKEEPPGFACAARLFKRAFHQSLISSDCFGVLRALFERTGGQQLPRANAAFGEELFEGSAAGGIWFARGVVICKGGGCSICADSQGRF